MPVPPTPIAIVRRVKGRRGATGRGATGRGTRGAIGAGRARTVEQPHSASRALDHEEKEGGLSRLYKYHTIYNFPTFQEDEEITALYNPLPRRHHGS